MKTLCLIIIMLTCLFGIGFFSTQQVESSDLSYAGIAEETLRPYFAALKNGDVASIKQRIAGKMIKRYRVLLDQNKSYPDFLRKYYHNVEFKIEAAQLAGDDILASTVIVFPGNDSVRSGYLLRKYQIIDKGTGLENETWKIIKQIEE
jgi:hypothetical protein